jgi:hypothetical protein
VGDVEGSDPWGLFPSPQYRLIISVFAFINVIIIIIIIIIIVKNLLTVKQGLP